MVSILSSSTDNHPNITYVVLTELENTFFAKTAIAQTLKHQTIHPVSDEPQRNT